MIINKYNQVLGARGNTDSRKGLAAPIPPVLLAPLALLAGFALACMAACGGLSAGLGSTAGTPTITSVSPASQYPGKDVTLKGTGFSGALQVTFGGKQALVFTAATDTQITATVPADAASGLIAVTGSSGKTGSSPAEFTVIAKPAVPVISAYPPSAIAERSITLTGSGFLPAIAVRFGGVAADTFTAVSDTQLSATVPARAKSGLISVEDPEGGVAYSNGPFTVEPIPPPAPTLDALAAASGLPGQDLTLTGANLAKATSVLFNPGQKAAIKAAADASLTVTVPETAVTGPITVTTPGGTATTSAPFVVQAAPPTVAEFGPPADPEGRTIIVQGSGLGRVTGVSFAGTVATEITPSQDGSSLSVKVPPDAASGALSLVTPDGAVPVGAFTAESPALATTGFEPYQGKVGESVTVSGAHLNQVTGIQLGTAGATPTVASDGASLTFQVPPGARTGPLTLVTAGGPVTAQGGDFTVLAEAPAIAAFTPAQGVPGTEVTLTGSGLGEVFEVQYAGMPLDASRFDVDSDTQVRVRVPDDAQASGTLVLASAAGAGETSSPFQLLPSRGQVLPQSLVQEQAPGSGRESWLDFPEAGRSALYGLLAPMAPIFQAAHPDGTNDDGTSGLRDPAVKTAKFSLFLKLPAAFLPVLPQAVQDALQSQGVDPANLDILCASQDWIYDGTSGPGGIYLFRANYWTDPDAPVEGSYDQTHNLWAALYGSGAGITLAGKAEGEPLTFTIRTHGPSGEDGPIGLDADSLAMDGLDVTASNAFWSLVVDQDTHRAAATLHLLLDDTDQAALDGAAASWTTLNDVVQDLAANPDFGAKGASQLLSLFRPKVDVITLSAPDASGNVQATLTGSCLAGATSVTLEGQAVTAFQPVSDAIVKVTLTAGAAGSLQVETNLGTSDPAALP